MIFSSLDSEDEGLLLKNRVPTPTTTLRRAKDSFINRQNVILKSYEEVCIHIYATVNALKL